MPYHINSKGDPGLCKATRGGCPFGSADEHFTTPEAARAAFEKQSEGKDILPENWTDSDLTARVADAPGLTGGSLDEIRKNLREDYEDALSKPEISKEHLIKYYAMPGSDYDHTNFDLEILRGPNGPYAQVTAEKESWQSGEPLTNVVGLISHNEVELSGWESVYHEHTYEIKLDSNYLTEAEATLARKDLAESYSYLSKPEYPDWMVLPANTYVSPFYSDVSRRARKAHQAVKTMEERIASASKASNSIQKYVMKIEQLKNDKYEVVKALSGVTSPRVKQVLNAEVKNIDSETQRTTKYKASAEKKANPVAVTNLNNQLKRLKKEAEETKVPLRASAERYTLEKLAAHHPSKDRRRSKAQAKAWLKLHPELVDTVLEENKREWAVS